MHALPEPEWCKPMTTGLWGLAYPLQHHSHLVLLSSDKVPPTGREPDRLWPFFLTEHEKRNVAAEKAIGSQDQYCGLLERAPFGLEQILCVREGDLVTVLRLLEDGAEAIPSERSTVA